MTLKLTQGQGLWRYLISWRPYYHSLLVVRNKNITIMNYFLVILPLLQVACDNEKSEILQRRYGFCTSRRHSNMLHFRVAYSEYKNIITSLCYLWYLHPSNIHQTFYACYLWPWLGPPVATLQYVMYMYSRFLWMTSHLHLYNVPLHKMPVMSDAKKVYTQSDSQSGNTYGIAPYTQTDSTQGSIGPRGVWSLQ